MTWLMLHMQARMFVEYLRSRDANALRGFVADVVGGIGFESSFDHNFGAGLSDVRKDFVKSSEARLQ